MFERDKITEQSFESADDVFSTITVKGSLVWQLVRRIALKVRYYKKKGIAAIAFPF